MKGIFIKFQNTIEAKIQIESLFDEVLEYAVDAFYSEEFYELLRKHYQEVKQKQAVIIGLNYPIDSLEDKSFIKDFIMYSQNCEGNLYYFPKATNKANINNFALFALKDSIALDVFKISLLQQKGEITIRLKEKLQELLYQSLGKENKIFKRFYPESKQLFELSPFWQEYRASHNINYLNLVQRATRFYPAPKGIAIQLNNICNLQCTICWHFSPIYQAMHDKATKEFYATKKELATSVIYAVLDYAGKHKCTVHFSAKGEPTIDKRLPDFIAYAKKAGCPVVSLITNATLLDNKLSKKLLENGLNRIYFSVDGATPETYKATRGVELSKVETNIYNFLEESKNYKDIRVRFNCTLEGNAINEVETFIDKWNPYANEIQSLNFTYVNTYTPEGESKKLQIQSQQEYGRVCNDPWLTDLLIIDPVGNVYPSCNCPAYQKSAGGGALLMGNVYQESLEEIWGGEKYQDLRRENLLQKFAQFAPCENCSSRLLLIPAKEEQKTIDIGTRRMFIFNKDEDR